jgi:hypothetical protein
MGSIVRNIARTQHDESHADATREVNDRIITRACREVDSQAEPQFTQLAERVRERIWEPLVGLGLEPTPIALETSATQATIRLRLAGDGQQFFSGRLLFRPRAPKPSESPHRPHSHLVGWNACGSLDAMGCASGKPRHARERGDLRA